jgi:hypothetical protein
MHLQLLHQSLLLFENRDRLSHYLNDLLEKLGISAEMIGGSALSAYNYRRNTEDIDIITSVDDANKLGDYLLKNNEFDFVGRSSFLHKPSDVKINLCPTGVVITNKSSDKFPEVVNKTPGLHVASLQRLLIMKLRANRFKDRGDVAELIKRNKITWDFIEREVLPELDEIDRKRCKLLYYKALKEE